MNHIQLRFKHTQAMTQITQQIGHLVEANKQTEIQKQERLKKQEELAKKEIKVPNYRTVPCKNFHGPQGCTRGDFCHFIHAPQYERQPLPREVF